MALWGAVPDQAVAACGTDALGTSRTLELDPSKHVSFQGHERALGLRKKEVILTFDDGPLPGVTPRVLKSLGKECVKATFFAVGKMAKAYPRLVRKVVSQGHTLAHHTHNHNRLPTYKLSKASSLIDRGISMVQSVAYGNDSSVARTPFFRYPYLARNQQTDQLLKRKGLIAFGTNIDSLDWKKENPGTIHNRIMRRLRKQGKGIILMHDIQTRTAKMLPRLLRSLKAEGYKVVHIVPAGSQKPKSDNIVVASISSDSLSVASVEKPTGAQKVKLEESKAQGKSGFVDTKSRKSLLETKTEERATPLQDIKIDTARSGVELKSVKEISPSIIMLGEAKKSREPKTLEKAQPKVQKKKTLKAFSIVPKPTRKEQMAQVKAKAQTWKIRRSQWIIQ